MNNSATLYFGLCFLFFGFLLLQGCEKNPPTIVPREAKGKEAVIHFHNMKDEPKYVHIKRTDRFSKASVEKRREERERARGIFRKQNRWDP